MLPSNEVHIVCEVAFAVRSAMLPWRVNDTLNAERVDPPAIHASPLIEFATAPRIKKYPGNTAVHIWSANTMVLGP